MDKDTAFKIAKKFIEYLKEKKYQIIDAYIFGSYAKGSFGEDSDIDLAVILKTCKNTFDTQVDLMKLRRNFDLRIEPHPFIEKDIIDNDPFLSEVIKTGIRI
ncbi:MAG: nucleotidyltransferase domain-containing protein [Candidatus Delongbacteria bacterium]|jgi:predicted nucleotidyltransferase|nr:nucleotidyltransferase domain-containing protein [Candidatus Delongbacteria bacterium]MDY0016212.1 nucleotidyltransferase domain-containing protein [Candidatus Delongbacteria bacterium]